MKTQTFLKAAVLMCIPGAGARQRSNKRASRRHAVRARRAGSVQGPDRACGCAGVSSQYYAGPEHVQALSGDRAGRWGGRHALLPGHPQRESPGQVRCRHRLRRFPRRDTNGHLIVFKMGSREKHGERLRSNRLRKGVHVNATPPPPRGHGHDLLHGRGRRLVFRGTVRAACRRACINIRAACSSSATCWRWPPKHRAIFLPSVSALACLICGSVEYQRL